ncbi:MAG: hypothetical protein NVSMB6_32970 [Burkholderiaceae bacterium]
MFRLMSTVLSLSIIAVIGAGCASQPGANNDGSTTLINGTAGLENWNRVGDANWRAADGAIVADKKGEKAISYLVSKNSYKDFTIYAEFWVSEDANSGIFLRCADPKNLDSKTCYEVNIYDKRPDPSFGTGAIVDVASVSPMPKAGGKCNTYEITAKGTHLTVTLNGVRTADVNDSRLASGPFALQYDVGTVKFRNVRIRSL